MTKFLDIDDMLEALSAISHPDLAALTAEVEAVADKLGSALALHFEIKADPASCELGFGGTCVAFRPAFEGQECPEPIHDGDVYGEWEWPSTTTTPEK